MKKIGLCVCYDTKNFGSQLQVLATLEAVSRLGYDFEIIRYKKILTPVFVLQSLPRLLNFYFVRGKINKYIRKRKLAGHPELTSGIKLRDCRFETFAEEHFRNFSKWYRGYGALRAGTAHYSAFLTGSDQLWLPSNLGSHFFTQEFVPDGIPKLAYATSFGVGQIPWYQRKRTARYLNRFDSLSVRERRGAKIIKELTGRDAKVVCDPTLLFDAGQWLKLIPEKKVVEGPYIFCYFLGGNPAHRKAAERLSKETGLEIVTVPFLDCFVEGDSKFGSIRLYDVDSGDFLNLVRNAEYILTDSFHGSVFSILYHKQFLTFDRFTQGSRDSRNSRIDSLLALLGLEDRRYGTREAGKLTEPIAYGPVEERLGRLRDSSLGHLEMALGQIP